MKVAIVLVFVVLVSTAVARPRAKTVDNRKKPGPPGPPGPPGMKPAGGIPRVTMKALGRLHKLFLSVCQAADKTLEEAAMNTTDIWALPDKDKLPILVGIGMKFHELGGALRHLTIRGKLLVIRLFISGFKDEDRCDGIMEMDMDMDMKREMTPGDYSKGEKRVMCLLRNMGEMISTFEDASAELEAEGPVVLAALPPPCDNMWMVANDKVAMLKALHADFVCLKHRMAVFDAIVKNKTEGVEFDSYEDVRKAMIKGQIIFHWMVGQTKETLEPFFYALHEMGLGGEASMEDDDSVEDASDFEEYLEDDEESGSGEYDSPEEDSGSGNYTEYEASGSGDYGDYGSGSGSTVPPPMRREEAERNVAMLIRLLMDQDK